VAPITHKQALAQRLDLQGLHSAHRVARHLLRKKPNLVQKKTKRGKKSQIVKNHEISAFSMCYHVFSKVVNKVSANGTVTDYAHGNLKFRHFQYITFAARSLNIFEGSLS